MLQYINVDLISVELEQHYVEHQRAEGKAGDRKQRDTRDK